jgi:hypothetical protein
MSLEIEHAPTSIAGGTGATDTAIEQRKRVAHAETLISRRRGSERGEARPPSPRIRARKKRRRALTPEATHACHRAGELSLDE